MNKDNKLIPDLRFPEFLNDEEWVDIPIKKAFKRITRKNEENNQNVLTISAQQGLVSQLEYFNKKVSSKDVTGYYLLQKGDFAYNKSYSNGYPMGVIKPLKFYDKGVVSTLYLCFRPKEGYLGDFFEQYFESGIINSEIRKIAQEGGRAHGLLNVGVNDFFEEVKLFVPSNTQEQQKIATCISSLDELISTHNDKLEALKDHKKGLLQNLFPQDGEKVPKYRFPEFEKDGKWKERTLSEVADYVNGKAHEKDIDEGGKYVVVNSKFISSEGETVKYSHTPYCSAEKGDILMVLSDVPNGKAIAKCFYVDEDDKYSVNQRICKVTVFDCDKLFLFYVMDRNSYFLGFDDGVKQTNLRKDTVLNFPFYAPKIPEEQIKISTFLSNLDVLISVQKEKIEQLMLHKKGLMQRLFPKIED